MMKTWIKLALVGLLFTASSKDDATFTEETQQEQLSSESRARQKSASSKEDATFTEETQQEQFSSEPKLRKNYILRFKTDKDLKEFIAANNDKDLLDEAQRMYKAGYLSLLLMYNMNLAELDSIGIDSRNMPIVHSYDDMLHLLLNRNGEIELAGYTMRIDEDFIFKYKNRNSESISEFLADYTKGRVEIEKGQTVDYNEVLTVHMNNNNESIAKDINQRRVTIHDYFTGGNYRMKSRQFNGHWLFYSSIGSSTKVQKKKSYWFFGWKYFWKTVRRDNSLEYGLKYKLSTTGFPVQVLSANGQKNCHCHIARDIYHWSVGFPVAPTTFWPVAGSGNSVHSAQEFSVSPNTEHRTISY